MDPTMPMDSENIFQLGFIDLLLNIVGIFLGILTDVIVPALFDSFFQGLSSLFAVPM